MKVDYHEVIEILLKNIVHHVLEDCWGVGETEWHHLVLEMSIALLYMLGLGLMMMIEWCM